MDYTEEQIRVAFWQTFYGVGELWFPYAPHGRPPDCDSAVVEQWDDFLSKLNDTRNTPRREADGNVRVPQRLDFGGWRPRPQGPSGYPRPV